VDGWLALVRPSRKLAPGSALRPTAAPDGTGVVVEVLDDLGEGRRVVRILPVGSAPVAGGPVAGWTRVEELAAIAAIGEMPLPPYITTPLADAERYQTVYADEVGSAAAPTAGLHLTDELLAAVESAGAAVASVELRVGLDTFRPITTERVEDHVMHTEAYRVPGATWDAVRSTHEAGGRVIVVGTTALRALESAAAHGELEGRTDLFIRGEHPFAVTDLLLTNFHLPRSSLLVLIDAFVGPRWRRLYADALESGYRFLSFGDAMLLRRGRGT
jgi:S-adenosylmethionine:tRNA ribosyltransferase-isomerase